MSTDAARTLSPGNDFERCVAERRPGLVRGGATRFERLMQWSPAWFVERYADVRCRYFDDGWSMFDSPWTTFGEFFGSDMAQRYYALKRYVHDPDAPLFIDDLDFPNPFLELSDVRRHIVFGGRAGTGVLPHVHGDALNFLPVGRKRWVLFDCTPETPGHGLWQRYWTGYGEGQTFEDWYAAEFEALTAAVPTWTFEQGPGDLVYVPAGFCHAVLNLEPVIGVVIERPRTDGYPIWWPRGDD